MKISQIIPTLSFPEFSYVNEHLLAFSKSELGFLKSQIPFDSLSKTFKNKKRKNRVGRPELFHPEAQIGLMFLKAKYNLSDKLLIERLNTDISFQLFCDIFIPAGAPLVDYKIVSRIRTKLSQSLEITKFQKVIAQALKAHISKNDLKILMSDATCYESHLRFPTNQKLLWESIDDIYKQIKKSCKKLKIRVPHSKYNNIREAYLSFSKTRKKTHKKKVKITRRLLQLLEKLLSIHLDITRTHHLIFSKLTTSRYSIIKNIFTQQKRLFQGEKIKNRIVSIFKPYLRPIIRGKESKSVEFGAKVNSIQVGGFNFVEHFNFNAFNEGIRVPECLDLHKILFHIKPRFFAGDAIYATNKNRSYCRLHHVITNFVPKGRRPKNDKLARSIRKSLNIARSTVLEGSFGTEKEYYSLRKVKARTKRNEILWILFGIHTSNFSRLASRLFAAFKEIKQAA